MPVSAPVPTLLKWRNPVQYQPDMTPFFCRGFIYCIDKVARYVEGEGLGLYSHAPKAVEKPENTAQSDVNKQVLHILLSRIFRSLKRIGRVIESSQRQLYPVLPAFMQLITQSFTWQVDRGYVFSHGWRSSTKHCPNNTHTHTHNHPLVPLILFQQSGRKIFILSLPQSYDQSPCPI